MSKPILFVDFDGTLCHDRFWRSLPSDQYEKAQDLLFRNDQTYIHEWMLGKQSAEEINTRLAAELGVPFQKLWELFRRDAETMLVSASLLEGIDRLRDRYVTILLTVNMDSFSRFTVPALKLDTHFDLISNSYYEGKLKSDNEGEIFLEYLKRFDAPASSSVLIDNSRSACDTFATLGGTALYVEAETDTSRYLSMLDTDGRI